jgi:acyl-CoA thioesterase-1
MKYLIILLIVLGAGLYLNRAYSRIYATIGEKNLPSPAMQQSIISPSSKKFFKKIVYVALGDSLTAGVGASGEDKTYPYLLAKMLAEKQNAQVTLINLGVPGAVASDVLKNQVPHVAQFHPDIISVAVGVNDMHNQVSGKLFAQTMSSIVDQLNSTTKHLNIINIPFIGGKSVFLPPYRLYFDLQTKWYNSLLNKALARRQGNIIDLYSLAREKDFYNQLYYSTDGFHPGDAGYDFWSKALYDYFDY